MRFTFGEWQYIVKGLGILRKSLADDTNNADCRGDIGGASFYEQQEREVKELIERIGKFKHD